MAVVSTNQVRSYFHDHHLASSLPHLPPKHLKLLTNHLDAGFLDARRAQLQAYLQRLVAFPHAGANPDLVVFLGVERCLGGEWEWGAMAPGGHDGEP